MSGMTDALALADEYRPSMNLEVLHSWAAEAAARLRGEAVQRCTECGEDEPGTGACGSSSPRALCNRPQPATPAPVACQACGLPPISAGLPPLKTCCCARLVINPAPVAGEAELTQRAINRDFVEAVKQLCRDYSCRQNRPYMADVLAQLDYLPEQLGMTVASLPVAGGAVAQMFILGREYATRGGAQVTLVSIHNAGCDHETMACAEGVHRYTRRLHPLNFGRVTGTDGTDPRDLIPPSALEPVAPAPVAGEAVDGWQYLAADWLEQQAEEQEETNAKYPQHAAAYKAWRDRPLELRMLAEKVKKAEGTLKRHCPPPSWMFPGDCGAVSKLPESWEGMAQDLRTSVGGTHKGIAREECARELRAALAQDRASQAGAAGGAPLFPNGSRAEWQDNLGRWWPVTITNWHSATYSARLDDGTDALKYPTSRFRAIAAPTPAADGEVRNG